MLDDFTIKYYNMKGEVVPREEGLKLFNEPEARRVAWTELPSGRIVSTVLLVFDHRFGNLMNGDPLLKPLIFETMVFEKHTVGAEGRMLGDELDMARYTTVEEARAGHEEMVRRWSS